jgi:hypothetical protein
LSPDALHLLLLPDAVLAISRLGWRRDYGDSRRYAVAADAGQWQGHAAALAKAFADFPMRRTRAVLSDQFVRYRLLPWRDDLRGSAEYQAWARVEFSNVYGSLADDWLIVSDDCAPGQTRLAAAVPAGLLGVLNDTARAAGRPLLSARPCFSVAVNAWQARFPATRDGWVMFDQPGQICVAFLESGAWRWLRQQRDADAAGQRPSEVLASEQVLAGIDAGGVTTLSCGKSAGPGTAGWQHVDLAALDRFPSAIDAAYAAAWLG